MTQKSKLNHDLLWLTVIETILIDAIIHLVIQKSKSASYLLIYEESIHTAVKIEVIINIINTYIINHPAQSMVGSLIQFLC